MTYSIGIDLGTTFTAAATWRDGHAEIASLGSRAAVIPSVVLLREDETVLTGETAHRRGLSEPHRVSREFKRRLGDTTPILLGGVPYSAEALMGRLLRAVVDDVTQREGGPPTAVCVSHPANWGPYKKDLLQQAVRISNIECPVSFTTEPEAAAVFYARQQRVEPGAVVAVYDLGGGTFDAAVLRKTATGFEILGQPEGIERLGGIDFDAAVFNHVRQALGGKLDELDEDDPTAIAAVARLREECVAAKEALSSDTDASIPVLLPNTSTEIRLTRSELEGMVRPTLHATIEALRRALRSAQVTPEQLHSVLLIGGSSRMPLVSQLVGAELGRPVAVDAHPKHAVALGAAWLASGAVGTPAGTPAAGAAAGAGATPPASPAAAAGAGAAAAGAAAAAAGAAAGSGGAAAKPLTPPAAPPAGAGAAQPGRPGESRPAFSGSAAVPPRTPVSPAAPPPRTAPPPRIAPPPRTAPVSPPAPPRATSPAAATTALPRSPSRDHAAYLPGKEYASASAAGEPPAGGSRRRLLLIGAMALALVLVGGTVAWAVASRDEPGGVANPPPPPPATDSPTQGPDGENTGGDAGNEGGGEQGGGDHGGGEVDDPPSDPALPADEQCTETIMSNPVWVCLTSATPVEGQLLLEFNAEWDGQVPNINGGFHLHIYGSDGTSPPDHWMGTQAGANQGTWKISDQNPVYLSADEVAQVIGDYPKVCARIAHGDHALVQDLHGGYATGNCTTIQW